MSSNELPSVPPSIELAGIAERLCKLEILVMDETYSHIFKSLRDDTRYMVNLVAALATQFPEVSNVLYPAKDATN